MLLCDCHLLNKNNNQIGVYVGGYSMTYFDKNSAHNEKTIQYNPLVHTLKTIGWQVNPLITITAGLRGAIHEQPIKDIEKLKIPKNKIKTPMKHLQHISIKYLTYLILNKKRKKKNPL